MHTAPARHLSIIAAFAGCGYPRLPVVIDDAAADGTGDAMIDAPSPLLLSEVVTSPSAGEMIEIVNTSNQPIDLSMYYLSDSGNYYQLPVAATVDVVDFIVKFPAGAQIAGHGVVTVALDSPASFASTYGAAPTFSVTDGSLQLVASNGTPRLTDTGEPIILFRWDGRSDLVRDVDIMIVGAPTTTNALSDKSGASQDGPDPDTQPSSYAIDRRSIAPQSLAPGAGQSTKRIALEDGREIHNANGNGPSGDDETTEDTSLTWDTSVTPFSAPTPGQVPAVLLR